ncbi:MAG TPA: APC family permease [Rhizomicrobium sp.]|jgi:APA family basic amino acid/polyamine antiporter|nr:APC family permease [Rhizomicrobium sp.]
MSISTPAPRNPHGELLRILGLSFGIAIALGGMIGAGILRTPSIIAGLVPNAWLILGLWSVAAIHALLEANIVAELCTAMPKSGGLYVYAQRAFGDVGGLIVGWTTWISRLASGAALSVAFADFLAILWPTAAHYTAAVAVGMQLVIYAFNMVGLREGRTIQQITSFTKAAALIVFCIVAVALAGRLHAASIAAAAPAQPIGLLGIVIAYQLIVGAYSGWYEPAFFAEENVNPGRSLPRAMVFSILLTAVLYVGVNAALLYALGVGGMAHNALPFTTVLNEAGGALPAILFAIGAMVVVASCANAGIMSAPRILLALSREKLLPSIFQNVNKGGSPYAAFALTATGSIALALSGSFTLLFGLIGTLGAGAAVLVIVSIFVLRRREPDMVRPFRALGYPWLPALVLLIDGGLLILFLSANWLGALYAAILWIACIPFAVVARRAAG